MPRSTYYKTLNKNESSRSIENKNFEEKIIQIYNASKGRYGAPKIHKTLQEESHKMSLKRVQRMMQKLKIQSITVKKFKSYSSKSKIEQRENVLNRDFSTTTINEKWVADITYVHTIKDGWCYFASVLDLCSRKIIGYSFSRTMNNAVVIDALNNAYKNQQPTEQLILHTDLGAQYTSNQFKELTVKLNIVHSFSKKGCPYDNACIESFHAALKKEEVYRTKYFDFHSAKMALFEYIEEWYNRQRIHGRIGYITPQEKENLECL